MRSVRKLGIWVMLLAISVSPVWAQTEEKLEPPPEDPKFPVRRQATPEEAVKIFQKRLKASPKSHSNRIKLGWAYLRWARESGNEEHYDHAAAEFQKVLKDQPKSLAARAYLASCYMAQHEFQKALELSQAVYKENSRMQFALATVGDAHFEMGNYDEADAAYRKLKGDDENPAPEILARLARLAEYRGKTDEAISMLQKALKDEEFARPNSSRLAWYQLRLGEVYFAAGQIEQANRHLEKSLELKEKSIPALLALGQVRAAQKRYQEAAALYEQVVEQKPDFDLIGDCGTLHKLAGNTEKAQKFEARAISLIPVAQKIETEARHLALFLADRDLQLDLALESARKELKVRKDVYAYDVLAWALLKSGKPAEAWEAMEDALRLDTKDGRMHYHAGLILLELGKRDRAEEHLSMALKINPYFGLTEPEHARTALEELRGS